MIKKIIDIIKGETGKYIIFGVLTTVVNYVSFYIFRLILGDGRILTVNTIAFILASVFAFITNKIYVFKSFTLKPLSLIKEIFLFFAARIFSFFIEQVGLFLCADVWHLEKYSLLFVDGILVSKVILSFVAVLLNWIASKYVIFKKEK